MTKDEYLDFCRDIGGAETDQPFEEEFDAWVARHVGTRKWFALIMEHDGHTIVNLKCEPLEGDFLKKAFKGITPAYHMNKTHWITVYLDSDVPDDELKRVTLNSFELTDKKPTRPRKPKKPQSEVK